MKFITIYGEIYKRTIKTKNEIFYLVSNSYIYTPTKGWFFCKKVGNKWKIYRKLLESKVEVYPDWID